MERLDRFLKQSADIQTVLFRGAAAAKAMCLQDIPAVNIVPEDIRKRLLTVRYSEQTERLVFLYAADLITADMLKSLALSAHDADILDDLIEFEEKILEGDKGSLTLYRQALALCANSKRIEGLSPLSFGAALRLSGLPHIDIRGGFVTADKTLYSFLTTVGERFGFYDDREG